MAGEVRGQSPSNADSEKSSGVSIGMARFTKVQPRTRSGKDPAALLPVRAGHAPEPLTAAPAQLWLCLYLPQLPLEARATRSEPCQPDSRQKVPLVICAEQGRRTLVVTANALAAARGVRPGMPVSSALALAPDLVIESRSAQLEAASLTRLAIWAAQFTPTVSSSAGNALLLEIQGSLRLFGGLEALQTRVAEGLGALGHEARIACAPTARAALWLATAGVHRPVRTILELRQALAGIHVRHLAWPERTVQALLQMGVTTVGDCVRLPREGFARRLGPGCLRQLDQAYGRHPDPRQLHVLPVRFSAGLELPMETTVLSVLLDGFNQLFQRLRQSLEARQVSVRSVRCVLTHPDGQETDLYLGAGPAAAPATGPTTGPTTGMGLLSGLLRLRLEAMTLPAPVTDLAVQADLDSRQVLAGTDLLGKDLQQDGGLHALLERLRARLGGQAVQGLALRAEHRPESAWRAVLDPLAEFGSQGGASEACTVFRSRPLWLLPVPESLGLINGLPAWHGLLALERGPERIESGWWDGGDVRRDYYRASNPQGAMLWVYTDLRTRAWYLQGIFG